MANINQTNNTKQISCSQDKLGEGGFSQVFKGKLNGRDVAVKRILVDDIDPREAEFLRNIEHRNILKLFHAEKDEEYW